MPEVDATNARPFAYVWDLMIADENGEYERAATAQRQLAQMGWYVSRKPPEEPAKSRRRRQRQAAEQGVAQ